MNVQRFRELQANILAHPEGLCMPQPHMCLMCRLVDGIDCYLFDKARKVLDLDRAQAGQLFNYPMVSGGYEWPTVWEDKLDCHTPGTPAYAQVVSDYMDWFYTQEVAAGRVVEPIPADFTVPALEPVATTVK